MKILRQLLMVLCAINCTAQIRYLRIANLDRWNDAHAVHGCQTGDVNTSTWAADGYVYMISDDTGGYMSDSACTTGVGAPASMPTQFSRWNGDRTSPTRTLNGWDTKFATMFQGAATTYGQTFNPAYSWKGTGMLAYGGKVFSIQCWQQYGGVQPSGPCILIYTSDKTNFITPAGTNVNLTPPYTFTGTAGGTTFGRTYRSGAPFFVLYGQEGTAFPNVDEAGTYAYITSCDNGVTGVWNNGNYCRLGRIAYADLTTTPFDPTKWFYYNTSLGGCTSVTTDAACWENTDTNATAILTETGHLSMSAPFWVPQQKIAGSASGRYLWPQWYLTPTGAPQNGTVVWYEAPSLGGPWTKIASQSEPQKGWYNLSPWQPSVFDTSTNLVTVTVSGDYSSWGAGYPSHPWNIYSIHFMDLELSALPFPPSVNFVHLSRSTKFGVAEGANRNTEFKVFYDFAGTVSGSTVPDLSGNGHTGTFTAPAGTGPGAMSNIHATGGGQLDAGMTSSYSRPLTIFAPFCYRVNRNGTVDDQHQDDRVYDLGNANSFRRSGSGGLGTPNTFQAAIENSWVSSGSMSDATCHVAYVRWNADGSVDLFDNGSMVSHGSGTTSNTTSAPLTIGAVPGYGGYTLNALIRGFYIRTRAMSDAEIVDETSYWKSKMATWANTSR